MTENYAQPQQTDLSSLPQDSCRYQPTLPDNQTQGGGKKVLFTSDEVIALRIPYPLPPPEPEKCHFCGRRLCYQAVVLWDSVLAWSPSPVRCDCVKALEYWARHDEEQRLLEEQQEQEKARQAKLRRFERLLGESGMKRRFADRTFDNFVCDTPERQQCWDIAKRYADNFTSACQNGDGLYMEGDNGTGKTHLAAAIALQLMRDNVSVIFKTSANLLSDLRATYDDPNGIQGNELLEAYKTADLLIIDDLGKEQCTDWSISTLFSILNDRYEDKRPVIITTNYGVEELVQALTPKGYDNRKIKAIVSRLRQTSIVVSMLWEDWRTKS